MFTSSVNAIDLPKHIIYDANKQEAVSISVLGKYIAIAASTEICLHNLDDSKGQCGQTQVYIYHVLVILSTKYMFIGLSQDSGI